MKSVRRCQPLLPACTRGNRVIVASERRVLLLRCLHSLYTRRLRGFVSENTNVNGLIVPSTTACGQCTKSLLDSENEDMITVASSSSARNECARRCFPTTPKIQYGTAIGTRLGANVPDTGLALPPWAIF